MVLFGSLKKDEEFKQMEKSRRIQRILDAREKSNNERVLESFQEEKRQEIIKNKLAKINEQRRSETFSGKFQPHKNIFTGHDSILKSDMNPLKSNAVNLGGKSLFFK